MTMKVQLDALDALTETGDAHAAAALAAVTLFPLKFR
jgi:hypothetical protein